MTRAHDPALSRAERRVVTAAMSRARLYRSYFVAFHEHYDKDDIAKRLNTYLRSFDREEAACAALERERREARKGERRAHK